MTSIQLTLCLLLMVLATLTALAQGIPPITTTTTTNTTKTTTTTNSTVTVHTENLDPPDTTSSSTTTPPPSVCRRSNPKHRVACQNWCLKQGRPGGKCKKNKCVCKPKRQPYN
uniref:Invertebrate defensins family profile domain-containing protein n=1 Tax=Cuerna arida TaxID=1464854 RepID=A0A1B6EZC1_9HEMI